MNKKKLMQQGTQLVESGQHEKARSVCARILAGAPGDPDTLSLLGTMAFRERNYAAAAEYFNQAIATDPGVPLLHYNLSLVMETVGQRNQAIASLQKAIALKPRYADAHARLGLHYQALGNAQAAHDSYQSAIRLQPGQIEPRFNLATLFQAVQRLAEAEQCYREVIRLQSGNVEALYQLGCVLQAQRKHVEAVEFLQRARQLNPAQMKICTTLVDILLTLGEFSATDRLRDEVVALLEQVRVQGRVSDPGLYGLIFYLPYLNISGYPARLLAQSYEDTLPPAVFSYPAERDIPNRKIRLGYISPHFGNQPLSHVTRGLYELHDRGRFEVTAYSLLDRSQDPGPYLADIRAGCDRFVDLTGITPGQVAQHIHDDQIDILVDLNGYMPGTQLPILSQRPAPLQVYWLGHGGGLGLSCIDYVIADETVIPPGEEALYTEKVVRLPDIYHSTDTPPIADESPPRSHFGLADDAFVFCAFNNPIKVNREVFDSWMRILQRVPGSQLWLSNLQQLEHLSGNYRGEAGKMGIDPDRLVFASGILDKSVHFARHRLADLFLDAFSYNASTTAIDALWAGLPVLTRKGDYFQSRIAASMLRNVGLEDMICSSVQEYEDRAVALAQQPEMLNAVCKHLSSSREDTALFDTRRFVRHLEEAYVTMWQRYRQGAAPESFDVPLKTEYSDN